MRHIQSFWVCCLLAANILLPTHKKKGVSTRSAKSQNQEHRKIQCHPFALFPNQEKVVGKQQGATESVVATKRYSGGHAQLTPKRPSFFVLVPHIPD